jgi:hypothetical protein
LENKKWNFDPLDKMIFEEGLRIKSVYFEKDLDVMLVLLNTKKIIQSKISYYKRLKNATEGQLQEYQISRTGIHWPALDEDLSLRGFLKEEMLRAVQASSIPSL